VKGTCHITPRIKDPAMQERHLKVSTIVQKCDVYETSVLDVIRDPLHISEVRQVFLFVSKNAEFYSGEW
jgi:hypothetical protein